MTLALWIILIPYGLYLFLCAVFAAIDVFHMVRFGTFGWANFAALFLFLAGAAFIFYATATLLAPVDWKQTLFQLGGIESLTEPPNL